MTQLDQNTLEMGLKLLEKMPQLIENFPSLPNINFPTMGGSVQGQKSESLQIFWHSLLVKSEYQFLHFENETKFHATLKSLYH